MTLDQVMVELDDATENPSMISRLKMERQISEIVTLAKSMNTTPAELASRGAAYVATRMSERTGATVRADQINPLLSEPEFQHR